MHHPMNRLFTSWLLLCLASTSAITEDLWTRYQFVTSELPSPAYVNTLHEDSLGQIWVGSDSGLFHIQNNKTQRIYHGPDTAIEHITEDQANRIWLATREGIWYWQSQTNNFIRLACTEDQSFSRLVEHPELGMLALASSGVYQVSDQLPCQKMTFPGLPTESSVERIALFNQHLMLAVRGHGLYRCDQVCSQVESFATDLTETRIREITAYEDTLYAGTHKHGFFALNNQGEVLRHWHRDARDEAIDFSLPMNGVMTLLPTEDVIWAGLWAGGLQQFDRQSGRKISSSRFYAPDVTTIGGRNIPALLISNNGTLYAGHENGVSIILPAQNQQGWIGLENESQTGFKQDYIFSLHHHNGNWITGTSNGGLYQIGHTDNTLLQHSSDSPPPHDLPTKSIWHIIPSDRGDLVLGTANGVIRLNPETLAWQSFGDPAQLVSTDVYSLTETSDQHLWLSLWEGGITRLDQHGRITGQWFRDDGLQQNTAELIISTHDDQVFVVNRSGLFRHDPTQDVFVPSQLHNTKNECTEIEHLTTDLTGRLWAVCDHQTLWHLHEGQWIKSPLRATEDIILVFKPTPGHQPRNEQLYVLTASQLLALDGFGAVIWNKDRPPLFANTTITAAAVVHNELVTGTNQGLYRQSLDRPILNTPPTAPIISGVRLFNKPLALTDDQKPNQTPPIKALYQGRLQLNYDQDLITIEFALPGHHHHPTAGFEYRLLPFDDRWFKTAEDETKATYTRLPPGRYHFEAKAITETDLPPATFELEVLPPWYLTWWAKTLFILTALLLITGIILGRTRRLQQSNLWLQESVRARTAELEEANNKLQQAANIDALTGLLNRRGLLNLSDTHWHEWQDQVILMIADIDHFKQINDQYGHQVGDEVLKVCTQRLNTLAGEHDLIARWGGEEFLLLLKDEPATSFEALTSRAHHIQQSIGATPIEVNSMTITVTITAGIAVHRGASFDACLQQADQKLYRGKSSGRNQLMV
jgi:diguanylate cyclase (GGDEF)-like protein